MANPEVLVSAVEFQVDKLQLIGVDGHSVDLRAIMRELSLYEDVFSNTMAGSVFINDAQNLINLVPILGTEYLEVTFIKPSTTWKMKKVFRVYKITDRRKTGAFTEDYILHFCSEELILSESIKISKSYKGMTVSDIVKDITTKYLGIASTKLPASAITSTQGDIDVVVPFWSPFYTINWLARMARSGADTGCSFLFFENNDGYHFTSIEKLSQQPPVQAINFSPANLRGEKTPGKTNMEVQLGTAEEYEMSRSPDLMHAITTGLYAGKLVTVNTLDQRINTAFSNAATLFGSTKHLNKSTFMQFGPDRTNVPQTSHPDSFYRVMSDSLGVQSWLLQRNAYLSALHGFQIKVVLPGNMNLRAGSVVDLNFPVAGQTQEGEKPIDSLFSGHYLITAVHHKIDRAKYVCILELSKDSLTSPLPLPKLSNPIMKKLRSV